MRQKYYGSLHISEFRDAHPMSLSGGQKQRVAIASAIASDKQVIVLTSYKRIGLSAHEKSGREFAGIEFVGENLVYCYS